MQPSVQCTCVPVDLPLLCVPAACTSRYLLGAPLDFSQHRGGIFLQEETRTHSSSSRITLTRLQVQAQILPTATKCPPLPAHHCLVPPLPQVGDSGDYTCSPAGSANATVRVVVATRTVKSYFSSTASWSTAPQLLLVLALGHTSL